MRWASSLAASLLLCASTAASAGRLIIQRCPLAGFTHHAAPALQGQLAEGDRLELVFERANLHDPQAVQIRWQGQLLGYLPRSDNGALARALHQGLSLEARISRLREHPDPRKRIEIEISARPGNGG